MRRQVLLGKAAAAVGVIAAISIVVVFVTRIPRASQKAEIYHTAVASKMTSVPWTSIKVKKSVVTDQQVTDASKRKVTVSTMDLAGVSVRYRQSSVNTPAFPLTVLLLHGACFSSADWQKLYTLQLLAELGIPNLAIDLPGYGGTNYWAGSHVNFMVKIVEAFNLTHVVLVSPSMSGEYSLPFLVSQPTTLVGFIPVAPVHTGNYTASYPNIETLTTIVYGTLDTGLGTRSVENLSKLPNHVVAAILAGKHPAYLKNPRLFHDILINTVNEIIVRTVFH